MRTPGKPKKVLPDDLKTVLIYFSERRCREWLVSELHPEGAFCPSCGHDHNSESVLQLVYSLKRIRCRSCGRKFSAYSGTVFEHTRLGPRQIVAMLTLFRMGRSNAEIARAANMNRSTVSRWRYFFRAEGSKYV